MTKWEYFAFTHSSDDGPGALEKLNKLGDEGWEAINATPGTSSLHAFFFFKRPKAESMQKENQDVS